MNDSPLDVRDRNELAHPDDARPEKMRSPGREADAHSPDERRPEAAKNQPSTDDHGPKKEKTPWYRRPILVGALMLVVIVGVVGGVLFWRHSRDYVSTEDAFIDIVAQRVSPQIPGRVLRVRVEENQDVAAGDTLVELDPADFANRLEQARASEAQASAQVAEADAQHAVAESQHEQALANATVTEANATNAANDLKRFQELRDANVGAVSQQQLDRAVAQASGTAAQWHAAQKAVSAAEAQVDHAAKQIDAAKAGTRSATAQVDQAQLNLSYTEVKASADGRIARKTVAPGNYVQPGADLMAVVPRAVYVTANFKETQLAHMRRGQRAEIKVDSYPDLKITGRLDGVQPATGQVFDQLPSQNAAGNWVKVVQRVPVKIVLDQLPADPDQRLAPGMSVTVTVAVH